jgi:hypothetical protein
VRCKAGLFSRFVPLAPGDITGLTGWWDASDSSTLFDATSGGSAVAADGSVARIEDKSGNSRHFTQGTAGARPLRKTGVQNSLDVLRLDGSDDFLGSIAFTTLFSRFQLTCFIVAKATTIATDEASPGFNASVFSTTAGGVIMFGVKSSGSVFVTGYDIIEKYISQSYTAGNWILLTTFYDGTNLQLRVNGGSTQSVALSAYKQSNVGNLRIGANYNSSVVFNGDVGEIITYNQAISTADREGLESVLMDKWAIT